jgi:hypothetical protein
MSFVSFASSAAPWTPLRHRRHTCAISGLYGVIGVHFKEARTTLLIPTELVNTLMILFLSTEALGT